MLDWFSSIFNQKKENPFQNNENGQFSSEKNEEENSSFQIQSSKLYLTYSDIPEHELSNFDILKALQNNLILKRKIWVKSTKSYIPSGTNAIVGFCIGKQYHQPKEDGTRNIHFHAYIRLITKLHITKNRLDLKIKDKDYKGKYYAASKVQDCINYCKKHGDFIQHDLYTGIAATILNTKDPLDRLLYLDITKQKGYAGFWEKVYKIKEEKEALEKQRTYQILNKIKLTETDSIKIVKSLIYPGLAGFRLNIDDRPKAIYGYGPTGTGKSTLIEIVKELTNEEIFLVTSPKSFSSYKGERILFFDEFDIKKWILNNQLRQQDNTPFLRSIITDQYCKTPTYYGDKDLPWPRSVFFCSNQTPEYFRNQLNTIQLDEKFATLIRYFYLDTNQHILSKFNPQTGEFDSVETITKFIS